MGSWNGDPIEIIPGTPEDVGGIRSSLINMVLNGGAMGASQYGRTKYDQLGRPVGIDPYRLNAGTDPQQVSGTNILNKMAGLKPYKPATDNLYAHPEWGTFTPSGPEPGRPGPGPRDPRTPRSGAPGSPAGVSQALSFLNAKRKKQNFGA